MSLISNLQKLLRYQHASDAETITDTSIKPDKFSALAGATISDLLSVFINDCDDTRLKLTRAVPIWEILAEIEYELENGQFDISTFKDDAQLILTTVNSIADQGSYSSSGSIYTYNFDLNVMMSQGDIIPLRIKLSSAYGGTDSITVMATSNSNQYRNVLSASITGCTNTTSLDTMLNDIRDNWDGSFSYCENVDGFYFYAISGTRVKASQVYENLSNSALLQTAMIALNNSVTNGNANVSDVMTLLSDFVNVASSNIQRVISMIRSFGSTITQQDVLSVDKSMVESFGQSQFNSTTGKMEWKASTYHVQGWNVTTFISTISSIGTTIGTILLAFGKTVGKVIGIALSGLAVGAQAISAIFKEVGNTVGDINLTANNRYYSQPFLSTTRYYPASGNDYFSDFRSNFSSLHDEIISNCNNSGWCIMYCPYLDFIFQKDTDGVIWVTGFINLNYGSKWPKSQEGSTSGGPDPSKSWEFIPLRHARVNKPMTPGGESQSFQLMGFGADILTTDTYFRGFAPYYAAQCYFTAPYKEYTHANTSGSTYEGDAGGYRMYETILNPEIGLAGFTTDAADAALRARLTKSWMMINTLYCSYVDKTINGVGNTYRYQNLSHTYCSNATSAQTKSFTSTNSFHGVILNMLALCEYSSANTIDYVCSWDQIVNYLFQSSDAPWRSNDNDTYISILRVFAYYFQDSLVISTPRFIPNKFFLIPAKNSMSSVLGSVFTVIALTAAAVTVVAATTFAIRRALQYKASNLLKVAEDARQVYFDNPTKANMTAVRRASFKANILCGLGGFGTYNWMQDWFEVDSGYSQSGLLAVFTESDAVKSLEESAISKLVDQDTVLSGISGDVAVVNGKATSIATAVDGVNVNIIEATDHIDANLATTADVYSVVANIDDNLVSVNENVISVVRLITG